MIKNNKVYVGFIAILLLIGIQSVVNLDYLISVLTFIAIALIVYQIRVNEDVKIVIVKNRIKRKFSTKSLQDYYVVFLEISNLSTYSQFYNLRLTDHIINQTYQLLRKTFNNVFLYSSDQFVIIHEFEHKTIINQRLRNEEQQRFALHLQRVLEHHEYHIVDQQAYHQVKCTIGTGSMGIREHFGTIEHIIKLAHFAMIQAKEKGEKLLVATEETRLIKEDVDIFNQELEQGLEYDEIVPYFLPIVDPTSMRIIGCESLLRWEKNEYRIIEAAKFKRVAEEKNLFNQLDRTIIKKTFVAYRKWIDDDLVDDDFTITINIGCNTLESMNAHELLQMAEASNIPTSNIEIDISEHDMRMDHTIHVIEQLRSFGFRVAIDAFNANNTILKTLSNIPVDTIKLDRMILPENDNDINRIQFYRMIVKLSKTMGYQTMAKGVENKVQLNLAKDLQVDYIQGYYITPPLNDMRIRGFLNKYHHSILA